MNLIGRNRGLEKTLYDRQEMIMMDTNLLQNNEYDYFHFDFHAECHHNSDTCMEFLKNLVLPDYLGSIGLFVQRNDIVEEVSNNGTTKVKKLV